MELERTLQEAQRGDPDAFARLVEPLRERLEPLAYLLLGKRLRQRVDVEDVIQETMIRAHQALQRFVPQGDDALFRWLSSIATHVVEDLARRHGAARRGGLEREAPVDVVDPAASTPTPSRALRRRERLDRLEAAIETLSPEHREAILLSHLQGLATDEVAQRMGRSRPAAAMLILRALRELRRAFGTTDSLQLPDSPWREPDPGADR